MDEGSFVLDAPTFGLNMDLEADMSSADDLLFYLTDNQGQMDTTNGAFDAAAHLLFDDFPSSSTPNFSSPSSSFSSSPSSSSPASSPPSASFSFSSSPVSSPSSAYSNTSGESSPAQCTSSGNVDADHFVFGSWIESALDTSTISPAQLQMSGTTMLEIQPPSSAATLPLPPIAILTSPASAASEEVIIDAGESTTTGAKQPKKDTRKRKRTKKNGDEAPPQTAVTLPRDELLKLSSQGT
jgi:PAB-dependent poly(A)-specific ribonuclease subunit 2